MKDETFVVGTLNVECDCTQVLLDIQTHFFVGKYKKQTLYESVGMFTSSAGTNGINDIPTNILVCNTQAIPHTANGSQKNQYVQPIIPPLNVEAADLEINEAATRYANQQYIASKLEDIYEKTNQYKAYDYKRKGVTKEDLEDMLEINDFFKNKLNNNIDNEDI